MIPKFLKSIIGENISFTGRAWINRKDLQEIVLKKHGYITPHAHVTEDTTVLVKGDWHKGDYGPEGEKGS